MAIGRLDAWGDNGHEIGRLPTAFDKKPPKGDSNIIDGRPLTIKPIPEVSRPGAQTPKEEASQPSR